MKLETYPFADGTSLEIHSDHDVESPRSWDNNGRMVCFHRRYTLGDETDYKSDDFNGYDELRKQIEADHDVVAILPLYLFDHSGLSIRTTDAEFRACDGAGWDWGFPFLEAGG